VSWGESSWWRVNIDSSSLGRSCDKRKSGFTPINSNEALREVALDIAEGADMVMVKPGWQDYCRKEFRKYLICSY
jgi:delta-aminolevulinic acid dehydratase/porphobilinogen synthase